MPDKRAVIAAVRSALAKEIAVLRQSAAAAREGATHEQAKPENDKDTRALEASYLAGAQAGRVKLLEAADKRLEFLELKALTEVGLGALVEVAVDGTRARYVILEVAGGTKVRVDGVEIQVLTPEAPLGQLLLGKRAGDVVERTVRNAPREYEILSVS